MSRKSKRRWPKRARFSNPDNREDDSFWRSPEVDQRDEVCVTLCAQLANRSSRFCFRLRGYQQALSAASERDFAQGASIH